MAGLHLTIALFLFSFNLLAGVWGVAAWLLRRPSTIFWYLLRAGQVSIVVQAVSGVIFFF